MRVFLQVCLVLDKLIKMSNVCSHGNGRRERAKEGGSRKDRRRGNGRTKREKEGESRKDRRRKRKYGDSEKACSVGTSQLAAYDSKYQKSDGYGGHVSKHFPGHSCCLLRQEYGDWSAFGEGSIGVAVGGGCLVYGRRYKVEDSFRRWRQKILEAQSLHFQEFIIFMGGNDLELFKVDSVRREVLDQDEELGYKLRNGGVQEHFLEIDEDSVWLENGGRLQRTEVATFLSRLNELFNHVQGKKYICSIPIRYGDSVYLQFCKFYFNQHLKYCLSNSSSTGFHFVNISHIFDVGSRNFNQFLCNLVNDTTHYNAYAMGKVANAINAVRHQTW